MNGDDLLSELRAEMRSYADARATGSEELEAFVAQLATALNKPRMNEQALEIAQRMEAPRALSLSNCVPLPGMGSYMLGWVLALGGHWTENKTK